MNTIDEKGNEQPAVFRQLSHETRMLIDKLKTGAAGTRIPHAELSKIIGRDVSTNAPGGGYHNLAAAMRIVEREHRIVWANVRGEKAICCLNDSEKVGVVDWRINK